MLRLWPGLLTRGARWGGKVQQPLAAAQPGPRPSRWLHATCHPARPPPNRTLPRQTPHEHDLRTPEPPAGAALQAGAGAPVDGGTELEALGIDSLGTVELLWSIEESFLIKVPTDAVNLLTLGDVVRYIDELDGGCSRRHRRPQAANPQPKHTA
jgi:hypothetical protein